MKTARENQAFTLIELLAVVAIIMLLLMLVLAGIKPFRERANKVKCAANLRSIAAAVLDYALEHDGHMAQFSYDTQYRQFEGFGATITDFNTYRCPSASGNNAGAFYPQYFCTEIDGQQYCTDYKMNDSVNFNLRPISALHDPSWVVVALDTDWGGPRHGAGNNMVFLAGHVRWFPLEDIWSGAPYHNQYWWDWGIWPPPGQGP